MNRQLLIIFGFILFLNSCKQSQPNETKASETNEGGEVVELNSVVDSYFESDSLVIILKSELEKIALNPEFEIHKESTPNKHVDNLIDTIITRTFKNTKLTSYKTINEEWFYEAKIENTDFELNDFIKVGTKKDVIEKHLAIEIKNDSLRISNSEQTSAFLLIFESGVLKLIEYEGYMD